MTPDSAPQYSAAWLGALPEYYVTVLRPCATFHELDAGLSYESGVSSLCKEYITQTCEIATFERSRLLETSLLALSLCLSSHELHNHDLSIQGMRFYQHALSQVRDQITDLVQPRVITEAAVLTVVSAALISAMYEVRMKK